MYGFGLETVCRTSKQLFENNNDNNNNNNNSNNKFNPLNANPCKCTAQVKSLHQSKKKKEKNPELGTCIYFCNIHQ